MKNCIITNSVTVLRRLLLCAVLCASVAMTASLASCSGKDGGEGSGTDSDTPKISDTDKSDADDHIPAEPEQTLTETETETAPPAETDAPADTTLPDVVDDTADAPADVPADGAADTPIVELPTADGTADAGAESVQVPDSVVGALIEYAGMTDSGQFVSEQSKTLKLLVDWDYVILDDGTAQVTVNIGISHYRLFANEKFEWGAVQADGNATLFTTPAIAYDKEEKGYTPFWSGVYTTDRATMELEASWKVLGTYGGVEIDSLTAGGTITFGEE